MSYETMSKESTTTRPPTGGWNRDFGVTARGTVVGTLVALAANSVVYVAGNLGAPIQVVTGWAPDGTDLSFLEVVATSTIAIVIGGLVLGLLAHRSADPIRPWVGLAAAVAIVSAIPLWQLDVDAGSKVSLTIMHLLTGAAAIAGHVTARRSRSSEASSMGSSSRQETSS